MKKKILVTGPALTTSGYGEQSRFALRALRSREDLFDIYLTPTAWGQCGWIHEDNEERKWLDSVIMKTVQYTQASNNQPQYDMSLQITIPNEWKKLAPINVGYTAGIEVNKISPHWVQPSNEMDKIIVVSSFAKKGFDNGVFTATDQRTGQQIPNFKVNTPIEVVNYSVRKGESTSIELDLTTDFNFLVVAQAGPRKNFANTVKWFVEEFKNDNVGLICKTHLGGASQIDREAITNNLKQILAPYSDRKCKVYLLHGDMNEGELTALYTHPKVKALVSLSHGEGFGLPIFEAAGYGLPVITTEWSGHTDFMYCENKEGKVKPHFARVDFTLQPVQPEAVWNGVIEKDTMWAFPVGNSAKTQMRAVYKDHDRYRGQAKRLATHIEKEFETNKIYEQFIEYVYGKRIEKFDINKLPKISLVTSIFKADEYIEQFMDDITRQTIFKDKCEWIIINPNSPGNEEEVIKRYIKKYPDNIVYKRLDYDPGIYDTWNMGIQMATGEYVTNANADDRKAINSIVEHAKALYQNPEIDLVYADSYIAKESNKRWEDIKPDWQKYNFEQFSLEAMLRGNPPHNNPMWRKTIHDKNGYFDQKYKSAGDWDFWLRCAFNDSKFMKINDTLGVYYFNPVGMSTNPEHDSWKKQHEKEIFMKYLEIYQERMNK
jgi:glycosyltransferase involved in cell wall biosynthesis